MSCKAMRNAMQTLLSENLNYGQEKKLLLLKSCQKTIKRELKYLHQASIIWQCLLWDIYQFKKLAPKKKKKLAPQFANYKK